MQADFYNSVVRGREALKETAYSFLCGNIVWFFQDLTGEQPFIKVNFKDLKITLKPDIKYAEGFYNKASIRFHYKRFPKLYFDVRIHSTIDPCVIESAEFSNKNLVLYYNLGKDEDVYRLPKFKVEPNCNVTIDTFEFEQSWEDNSLLEFDAVSDVLIVKKTEDLTLFGAKISATLTVYTHEYDRPLELSILVRYVSRGPEFRGEESLEFPLVPCSTRGLDWKFKMPEVVAEEQQEITINMIQD